MKKLLHYFPLIFDLTLFDGNTNLTTDSGLSDEMKTYYSDYLIDIAGPKLVHDQFAQKHPIPKNGGKIIEFRKYSPLPKATKPLQEGVTPDGQKLNTSVITAEVKQYGGFIELSDILLLTAIDNNLVQATKLLGSQAGRTLDTITREELCGGTNVIYGGGVTARHLLSGGEESDNDYLTVDLVKRGVRFLKLMNASPVDDCYVGIIHPDNTYDYTNDPNWRDVKTYCDPGDMYAGELGKMYGTRFVESTEAKVIHAENLTEAARNLSVRTAISSATTTVTVNEAITEAEAQSLAGRKVLIGGSQYEVTAATAGSAGSASLTVDRNVSSASANDPVYPGEAGAKGRDVYATILLGADAYGTTEIEGGGLQHIVKQLGSAGTADPLNQRATAGWKATKVAKRLVEEYMVRLETCSTFESGAN